MSEAADIYKRAHEALAELDEDKMHALVTEKCFPEMMYMARRKTIKWKYLKSLEAPRVVQARWDVTRFTGCLKTQNTL